jgi:hypothetical protein
MNHQSFDKLPIDTNELSAEQLQNWKRVHQQIKHTPMASPRPGFSNRFKASLAERREKEHKAQAQRFLIILISAALVIVSLILVLLLNKASVIEWFALAMQNATKFAVNWSLAQRILTSKLFAISPAIPLGFWIVLTSSLSLLILFWGIAMWRIILKGAYQNETT